MTADDHLDADAVLFGRVELERPGAEVDWAKAEVGRLCRGQRAGQTGALLTLKFHRVDVRAHQRGCQKQNDQQQYAAHNPRQSSDVTFSDSISIATIGP